MKILITSYHGLIYIIHHHQILLLIQRYHQSGSLYLVYFCIRISILVHLYFSRKLINIVDFIELCRVLNASVYSGNELEEDIKHPKIIANYALP